MFQVRHGKSGDESTTNTLIAAEGPKDIDFTSYQKITTTLADNLKSLVKAATGGVKINPSISICPIAKPAAQPPKKLRPNQDNGYGADHGNRYGCGGDRDQGNVNNNGNGWGKGN